MGWSIIQRATASSSGPASSVTATFGSTTTAGNMLVAKWGCQVASGSISGPGAVSDLQGNYYPPGPNTSVGSSPGIGCGLSQATLSSGRAGMQVSYTPAASGLLALEVSEYEFSIDNGFIIDGSSTGTGTSGTSLSSGSFASTGTNDYMVGVAVSAVPQTWTPDSGFTAGLNLSGSSTQLAFLSEDRTPNSSSPTTITATMTTSANWAICGACYIGFKGNILNAFPSGDAATGSATTAGANTLAAIPAGDAFAGTGHFSDSAALARATAGDVLAATGKFTSPSTLAHTTAGDTFAATGKFTDPAALAHTTAGDTFASSAHFASPATLAAAPAGDVFAGASHSTHAALAALDASDTFGATAHFAAGIGLTALENHDHFAGWTSVNPRLQATEHHDTFTATAIASTPPSETMAAVEGHDSFHAAGGFTFDTRAILAATERGEVFAGVATESSAGALAAIESHDVFGGVVAFTSRGTMAAHPGGDVFHGGFEHVAYHVFMNTGIGDPINYGSVVATVTGLTWTSSPLTVPGVYSFGVRAFYVISGLQESNLDCEITVDLNAAGVDISNSPLAPLALRAFPYGTGGVRVEWIAPPVYGPSAPTGFHVYFGTGPAPNYGVVAATVLASAVLVNNNFILDLTGLTGGTLYAIGVRAFNATAEETNTNTVSVTPISTGPLPVQSLIGIATSQAS